jgi:hypothetical protein
MHLFGHNRDHDYYFELPREGEHDPRSHVQKKAAWVPGRDTMWAYNTRQDPAWLGVRGLIRSFAIRLESP